MVSKCLPLIITAGEPYRDLWWLMAVAGLGTHASAADHRWPLSSGWSMLQSALAHSVLMGRMNQVGPS